MTETRKRVLRTIMQLVASGALTAIVNQIAGGLSPATAAEVLGVWTVLVTGAQNALETSGAIPKVLK